MLIISRQIYFRELYMVASKGTTLLSQCFYLISDPAMLLLEEAYSRISGQVYMDKFKLYFHFYCPFRHSIFAFFGYFIRNGTRAHFLNGYVSVFYHFSTYLTYPPPPLPIIRLINLFIKSVANNSPCVLKFKVNFTIPILLQFTQAHDKFPLGFIYKAISPLLILGFFPSPTFPLHLQAPLTLPGTLQEVTLSLEELPCDCRLLFRLLGCRSLPFYFVSICH